MLHAKFQVHRTSGAREELYGRGGHLGHVTWTIYITYRCPFPRRLHIKFIYFMTWPSTCNNPNVKTWLSMSEKLSIEAPAQIDSRRLYVW